MDVQRSRVEGAYLGLVVGDSLAMPVHWYYSRENLRQDYGEVEELLSPKTRHPESMVSGMAYRGSLDILHDKAKFYEGFSAGKNGGAKEGESKRDLHGNYLGRESVERVHYHATLKKGQNTANVCLARLLGRYLGESCAAGKDGYFPLDYLTRFKEYMTTPPEAQDLAQLRNHGDLYLDVYCRHFFEQASKGVPLMQCAHNQRDSWSVGSLDGVVLAIPLMLAYIKEPEALCVARVIEHHMLTHRSVTVSAAVVILVPLFQKLISGGDWDAALDQAMERIRPPKITGSEMARSYVSNGGPGNIPKEKKWSQHMELADGPLTLKDVVRSMIANGVRDEDVAGWNSGDPRFSTACYVEQSLPIVFYLACRYGNDFRKALTVNAALGGHSTARGALLGCLLGVRLGTYAIPDSWLQNLAKPSQIRMEAETIAKVAMGKY